MSYAPMVICDRDGILYLQDSTVGEMTIETEAQAVVTMCTKLFPLHRIVYRDRDSNWKELCYESGLFRSVVDYEGAVPE